MTNTHTIIAKGMALMHSQRVPDITGYSAMPSQAFVDVNDCGLVFAFNFRCEWFGRDTFACNYRCEWFVGGCSHVISM
jgi:hypothetical protein